MKINIKGFITSKKSELYADCADNYAFNRHYNKFAISDGVSKSFFPKIWSDILVRKYVEKNNWKDEDFIIECQKEWQNKIEKIVNQPEVKYYTRNAYIKKTPALATFVGLQFIESEQKWIAHAQGDSFLFFIPKGSSEIGIKLSSKPEPTEFDNYPDYLSSIAIHSHKGERKSVRGEKIKEGVFYLMTDALAEWFLQNPEQVTQKLSNVQNQEQFLVTIEDERKANRLNDDDSAILIINITDDHKKEISYSEIEIVLLSDIIVKQEEEIEESKKREISSLNKFKVGLDEKETEEKLVENDDSNELKEVIELSNETRQKKLTEEKPKQENIQKDDDITTSIEESIATEFSNMDIKLESKKEGVIATGFSVVKKLFKGKHKDEENTEIVIENKSEVESNEPIEKNIEGLDKSDEPPQKFNTIEEENSNHQNDKIEKIEKEKVIEEPQNDIQKLEPEKVELQELPKFDSKAKKIIDNF